MKDDHAVSVSSCVIVRASGPVTLKVGDDIYDEIEQRFEKIEEILEANGERVVYLKGVERGRNLWELSVAKRPNGGD